MAISIKWMNESGHSNERQSCQKERGGRRERECQGACQGWQMSYLVEGQTGSVTRATGEHLCFHSAAESCTTFRRRWGANAFTHSAALLCCCSAAYRYARTTATASGGGTRQRGPDGLDSASPLTPAHLWNKWSLCNWRTRHFARAITNPLVALRPCSQFLHSRRSIKIFHDFNAYTFTIMTHPTPCSVGSYLYEPNTQYA